MAQNCTAARAAGIEVPGFLALFVHWDAYRTINPSQKAACSIADLLSRHVVVTRVCGDCPYRGNSSQDLQPFNSDRNDVDLSARARGFAQEGFA